MKRQVLFPVGKLQQLINMERAAGFSQVIHTVKVVRCTGGAHHQAPDAR